ncbi:MAG: hypothetical protein JXB00_00915 [Bacteroidales bacterium]|nr:hypothetical protein [Bacteroidales bacterium]
MKKKIAIIVMFVSCFVSLQAFSNGNEQTSFLAKVDCTGKIRINGDSYTITLHDVSLVTCAAFKLVSLLR